MAPVPTTAVVTSTTLVDPWRLPDDLFCRDLIDLGYAYPEAVLYWSLVERPARMDADANGIPCETIYTRDEVVAFWAESATIGSGTVEAAVARVQHWYDDRYSRAVPNEEIVGPLQIRCLDYGPVVGGVVFVCEGVPQTKHEFSLDTADIVIYVLDPSGTSVWSVGTDLPEDTASLLYQYHLAPKGLSCAELADPIINAGMFSGSTRPPDDAFFYSMVYWSFEGRPDRMDTDHDGIPCESLYDAKNIEAILEGGPVPLYNRD
jgi:hypothetical protein